MRRNILALLLLCLGTLPALAQSAPATSEFEVNGLKVIVKQRPSVRTVAVGLFIRGGTAELTPETAGVEALLLDAMTEASAHFPRALLRGELSRLGSSVSFGVNRDYSVVSMASTRENFDRTWAIFVDTILHPSLLPADVERVKNSLVASARDRTDSPDGLLEDMQAATFKGHPYSIDPNGKPETLARLTAEDLRTHYRKIMQTSRLLLVLVGDLDIFTVRGRVMAAFGQLPVGNYRATPMPLLNFTAPSVTISARNLPTNYVQGTFAGPAARSADYPPLAIAISILRDRVYSEVRVKRNLSYAPNAFLDQHSASAGGIYVTAVDPNLAVQLMLGEITRLRNDPVDAETLTAVAAQFGTTTYMNTESSAAQAGNLARYELIGGGWRNADSLLDRLKAVTAADVQRVCRQYMRNLQFVVVGNESAINRALFTKEP